MADEAIGSGRGLRLALDGTGERLFRDQLLMTLHPGDMRIAEERNPLRP